MPIIRWNPYREAATLQNHVHSFLRALNEGEESGFTPAVDIYEDAEKVVLNLEVPGVQANDIDIRVENRTLTVKGERKFEAVNSEATAPEAPKSGESAIPGQTVPGPPVPGPAVEAKEKNFHRIERRYGSFYRAFTLPQSVDTENVAAGYNAGVLKLELKKKPEAQPKQIQINVAA